MDSVWCLIALLLPAQLSMQEILPTVLAPSCDNSKIFEMKNISFRPSGMELKIRGVPNPNCDTFHINVGSSYETVGLHISARFNYRSDQRVLAMNSRKDGEWQDEVKVAIFPFQWGQEFEMTITFAKDRFYINLHEGHMVEFPNRLTEKNYDFIGISSATVNAINVN